MLGAVLAPMELGQDIHLIDRWDPDARARRSCSRPTSARAPARRCSSRASSTIPTSRPSTRARIHRVGLGGAPVPVALGRARRRARHRDHPRVRIDRASVGHRLHVRRSGREAARHRRRADDRRRDPARRRRRRAGRARRRRARSGRAAPTSASATPIPRSPPTRSTPTAGTAAATWACVDADGFLTITDRVKDVIIRGGENISAAEIEEAIARAPAGRRGRGGRRARRTARRARVRGRAARARRDVDRARATSPPSSSGSAWPARSGPRSCASSTTSRAPPSGKVRKVDLRRQLRADAG